MLRKRGGNASKSVNNARASGLRPTRLGRLPKTRAGASVMLSTTSRRPGRTCCGGGRAGVRGSVWRG